MATNQGMLIFLQNILQPLRSANKQSGLRNPSLDIYSFCSTIIKAIQHTLTLCPVISQSSTSALFTVLKLQRCRVSVRSLAGLTPNFVVLFLRFVFPFGSRSNDYCSSYWNFPSHAANLLTVHFGINVVKSSFLLITPTLSVCCN